MDGIKNRWYKALVKRMQHRNSISFNIVKYNMLNSFGHHITWCYMMLYDFERSLISMKHLMQHFFCSHVWTIKMHLFGWVLQHCCICAGAARSPISTIRICTVQHVAFVWSRGQTSSSEVEFHNVEWCCIRLVTWSNIIQWSWIPQCWMMLHSFGHVVKHHPMKLNSTMLNDVAFVWSRGQTSSNEVEFHNVEWCCIRLART